MKLTDWRVFEVQQAERADRTRHAVGSLWPLYDGQVSSAIVKFDAATRTATTNSGNQYELSGRDSGLGQNASYTWDFWRSRCSATDVVDVTGEYEELLLKTEQK